MTPTQPTGNFGHALQWLRDGNKAARQGWNGKKTFVFLVEGSAFKVNRPPLLGIYEAGTEIKYNPHIDVCNENGSISTWAPSINDVLADDWVIVD